MNLTKLAPAWNQYKVQNGLTAISETEILSAIEPKASGVSALLRSRIIQNAFAYSLLIFALNGCAS